MEIAGIYTEFHQSLLSYIRSKIRSKEDAEDILQNVFIKISGNLNKLSEQEKLRSWIFTITRNSIIDYYRTNAAKQNTFLDEDLEDQLPEEDSIDSTKGLNTCLTGMISSLPDEYKDIIIDSELKGIKQKDLAEKYNMTYPSMRSRVQRGRERLKQMLTNCCDIEADKHGNILSSTSKNNCNDSCSSCAD
jgi:RNA polymerase sigma-70 factor (ECF subfamily)